MGCRIAKDYSPVADTPLPSRPTPPVVLVGYTRSLCDDEAGGTKWERTYALDCPGCNCRTKAVVPEIHKHVWYYVNAPCCGKLVNVQAQLEEMQARPKQTP